MADKTGAYDWERNQIDRIYETSMNVAKSLHRMADDIAREVARAQSNEGTTESFRSTYVDLPGSVTNIVVQGLANAQLDSPARQLRELILGRTAFGALEAQEVVDRLRAWIELWQSRPDTTETIYSYVAMEGPADDRHEVNHTIDLPLLHEIINLLPKKAS